MKRIRTLIAVCCNIGEIRRAVTALAHTDRDQSLSRMVGYERLQYMLLGADPAAFD